MNKYIARDIEYIEVLRERRINMLINEKLFDVMANVLQVNRDEITETSAPGNIQEWDSKHMFLLLALEEEFKFKFTDEEMAK